MSHRRGHGGAGGGGIPRPPARTGSSRKSIREMAQRQWDHEFGSRESGGRFMDKFKDVFAKVKKRIKKKS